MGTSNSYQGIRYAKCKRQSSSKGPVWRRHVEQLRPRYGVENDAEPGDDPSVPPAERQCSTTTIVSTRGSFHEVLSAILEDPMEMSMDVII